MHQCLYLYHCYHCKNQYNYLYHRHNYIFSISAFGNLSNFLTFITYYYLHQHLSLTIICTTTYHLLLFVEAVKKHFLLQLLPIYQISHHTAEMDIEFKAWLYKLAKRQSLKDSFNLGRGKRFLSKSFYISSSQPVGFPWKRKKISFKKFLYFKKFVF